MIPKISIIIPCYNAAPWLPEAIASALTQNVTSQEIIIVDDGSTDNSLEVARSFASEQVTVLSQPNQGAASARNTALRAARGEYIQYLDADDMLGENKISRQITRLEQAPAGAVATCRWAHFEAVPADCRVPDQENFQDLDPVQYLQLNWEQDIMLQPAAWLVPREIIERVGPWDESLTLNDDGEYFARVALASSQLAFTAGVMTYYRSHLSTSLSGRTDADSLLSAHRSVEQIESYLLARDTSNRTEHACAAARQRLAYCIFPHLPELATRSERRAKQLAHGQLPPPGGGLTQLCAKLLGWRNALRLQAVYSRHLNN
jgi:glycosyltransferase involved in cell wall biosynthesis